MKDISKIIFFALAIIFSCGVCKAQFTYVDFSLESYLVIEEKETKVSLIYNLSGAKESDFIVRPIVENGIVEILDSKANVWVGTSGFISSLPNLSKNITVRFKGLTFEKSSLWFEIKSLKTGKSYLTPKKSVWTNKIYEGYVENINESVVNYSKRSIVLSNVSEQIPKVMESTGVNRSSSLFTLELIDNIPRRYFMYMSICLLVSSSIVGFISRRKPKVKEMVKSICE